MKKSRSRRRIAAIIAVRLGLIALVVESTLFAMFLLDSYREPYLLPPFAGDLGICLAGGKGRIDAAFRLLKEKRISVLLLSGTSIKTTRAEIVDPYVLKYKVDARQVYLENNSRDTIENAVRAAPFIHKLTPKSLLLITSDYHMKRALMIFRSLYGGNVALQGFAVPTTSGRVGEVGPWSSLWWVTLGEFFKYQWQTLGFAFSPDRGR